MHAFCKNNPENGFAAREAGLLPVVAFHHLRGRGDKKNRQAKEALVTLGVAVDQDETSREIVASFCGEIVLRECLAAGAGKNTKIPPPIADEKRLAKEQATLREVEAIAAQSTCGEEFLQSRQVGVGRAQETSRQGGVRSRGCAGEKTRRAARRAPSANSPRRRLRAWNSASRKRAWVRR